MTTEPRSQAPHLVTVSKDASAPSQNRINGVFDLPSQSRVSGWAIDRADSEAAVTVELYREGKLIATTQADRHRPDLERGGIGTGKYGFVVDLDPPLEPGMAFTLNAQGITADGMKGPLRGIGTAQPSVDTTQLLFERLYTQMGLLGGQIGGLRATVSAPQEPRVAQETLQLIERVEMVQARLEVTAAALYKPTAQQSNGSFRWAVGLALAIGSAGVLLGLWSVIQG